MREILFKAKRADNDEWVEGYLFETKESAYIVYANQSDDDLFLATSNIFIHVDKYTICQYTGLTDKNGNRIWENDCIGHRLNVVEFLNGTWCVSGDRQLFFYAKEHGVIGNIFDDDDLIGE